MAPILAVVFPSAWMRACSLLFISGKDNKDSLSEIVLFIYVLGYLRFDYKRCLTCFEKFIGNVWDSFCMHFEGGKQVEFLGL